MRFLCLHGMGTNAEVFEMQTAALRFELGDRYKFEFVEGTVPWPAAPGIQALFPSHTDFYAYYDSTSGPSILSALDLLHEYIAEEGPFDGVVGFSQGAALAATLMIRHDQLNQTVEPLFRCAIFMCGAAPCDWRGLDAGGKVRKLGVETDGKLIHVPTAHILGANDEAVGESHILRGLCGERGKVVYDHGGGHEVPRAPKEVTLGMAQAVRDVIDKANFVQ
ncbi:DUF341 domain-containing protein [Sphaerosporella brunnea]|uniref:DUF341 domain-containing protein n=1 Tax=Sphaerosporella brunnea TaxID=1250544 RepID=A0A5J5EWR4_9PEZI|nr:DUF341 domain-containing protein [Sphaerosporella brunnea]